jgi:hypothetical protein
MSAIVTTKPAENKQEPAPVADPLYTPEPLNPERMRQFRELLAGATSLPLEYQMSTAVNWLLKKAKEHKVKSEQVRPAFVDLCMVLLEWMSPDTLRQALMTLYPPPKPKEFIPSDPQWADYEAADYYSYEPAPPPWSELGLGSSFGAASVAPFVHDLAQSKTKLAMDALKPLDLHAAPKERRYFVRGILTDEPGVIGGIPKGMKTTFATDLAVSCASGKPFLGCYPVQSPVKVVFFSGESGAATLTETVRRIAQEREAGDMLPSVYDVLPSLENLPAIIAREKAELVIIDPLYLFLRGAQLGSIYDIGAALADLTAAVKPAVPIIVHHTQKTVRPGRSLGLADLTGAGVAEWARQWFLVNRRQRYSPKTPGHHELVVSVGGSAGHSELFSVDIDEGELPNRTYRLSVRQAKAEQSTPAQPARTDPTEKIVKAMDDLDVKVGDFVPVKRLKAHAGVSGDKWKTLKPQLLADGFLSEREDKKLLRIK